MIFVAVVTVSVLPARVVVALGAHGRVATLSVGVDRPSFAVLALARLGHGINVCPAAFGVKKAHYEIFVKLPPVRSIATLAASYGAASRAMTSELRPAVVTRTDVAVVHDIPDLGGSADGHVLKPVLIEQAAERVNPPLTVSFFRVEQRMGDLVQHCLPHKKLGRVLDRQNRHTDRPISAPEVRRPDSTDSAIPLETPTVADQSVFDHESDGERLRFFDLHACDAFTDFQDCQGIRAPKLSVRCGACSPTLADVISLAQTRP